MPKSAEELLAAAMELTNPADRGAWLEGECANNIAPRAEVESLPLPHTNKPASFLRTHLPLLSPRPWPLRPEWFR